MKMMIYNVAVGLFVIAVLTDMVLSCPSNCSCTTNSNGVTVDCHSRGLTVIPRNFPNDSYRIEMINNSITTIEDGAFGNMALLYGVFLGRNYITTIQPGMFKDLPALEYIYLDHNRITTIQPGTFKDLSALRYIYLISNQITIIQQGVFKDLPALSVIWLNQNRLTALQRGIFDNLQSLSTLFMDSNRITTIQQGTFQYLPSLTNIDLRGSSALFVTKATFENITNLRNLHLTLVCDCNFWSWLKSKSWFNDAVTCVDRGYIKMSSLQESDFDNCTYSTTHLTYPQQESTTSEVTTEITAFSKEEGYKRNTILIGIVAGIVGLIVIIAAVILFIQRTSMLKNCHEKSNQRNSAVYENEIRLDHQTYQDLTLARRDNHLPYDVVHIANV